MSKQQTTTKQLPRLKKNEDAIIGVEINFILEKGDPLQLDLSKQDMKIILSLLNNLFKSNIPFK